MVARTALASARWLGTRLMRSYGTDEVSRRSYRQALADGVYSALPVDRLPSREGRPEFAGSSRCGSGRACPVPGACLGHDADRP
jgi:hypothetical protein